MNVFLTPLSEEVKQIIEITAKFTNISEEDLLNKREPQFVNAKAIAILVVSNLYNPSKPELGRYFKGNKDKYDTTSVLNLIDKAKIMIDKYPSISMLYDNIVNERIGLTITKSCD